uniref:SIR2 family protein n=1 Tax=Elstera sp. TaxID=1916664 RepID=UPI0037BF84C1
MIDLNQNSLVRLKTKVAESAKDIVFCVGSGVSSEAGAPSWGQLFNLLADEAFAQLKNIVDVSADKDEAELIYLRETKNFWKGFERIKNIIGDDHYYRAIKEEFDKFINVEPPKILKRIWSLKGVNAVITPNVDNFVLDAHRKTRPAQNYIAHFNSLGVKDRLHLIRNSEPFIFHMHGNFDQASSLVFSESDLSRLFGNKSYIEFMKGVFLRYSVIFIGVTADDRAFDEILLRVREAGISFADHYWITTRRDMNTHNWSVKYGIKGIYYDPIFDSSGKAVHFDALNTIFDEIEGFKSYDVDPEIIIPSDIPESPVIPSDDLMRMPSNNDRRLALAGMAKSILINSEENTQSPEYRKFVRDYALPIHTAWFISNEYPENDFMGYKVEKKEVDGKFSNIWIVSQKGQRYALKMLKQENIQDSIYLDSFRRGVQSLRYLSNNGVDESVRLVSAYEIPASLIMEYIDGINLEDLVRKREFDFWGSGLPIVISIAKHLLKCHN